MEEPGNKELEDLLNEVINVKKMSSRFWGPRRVVTLQRVKGERLGINIWGGTLDLENNRASDFVTGIFIKSIVPDTLAHKTGQFHDWDRILEVNGVKLETGDMQEGIRVIMGAGDELQFTVQSLIHQKEKLPITLLCGFLGAGKTTLLKHVLETKHAEEDFKCAVIVNDMAALNIDKSLIDQSALVQSDEVIAMQNGCFCCTLSNDLVDQIKDLASKNMFNYMLLEASGVSEPSQIAPLFDLCDDNHNHAEVHTEGPQLGEVARLDTCVTVIDGAEFHNSLDSMAEVAKGEETGTISELLMEQVEFSNIVILNKTDLVNKEQQEDILERINILNPKVKVLKSCQSKIDVMEILNTQLYNADDMGINSVTASASRVKAEEKVELVQEEEKEKCCNKEESDSEPEPKKCCKKKDKDGQELNTGLSQILLGVVKNDKEIARHQKRFGISSFIYRARRPFHPGRLYDAFLNQYFSFHGSLKEEKEETKNIGLENKQMGLAAKGEARSKTMGGLMRSKGFVWIATSQFFMGAWQQAGNVLRIKPARPWLCEIKHMWEGSPAEEQVMKEMRDEDGKDYPYGDRCQELVFIGKDLKHRVMQRILDTCLLTDEEMEMGERAWQKNWYDSCDKIRLPTKLYVNDLDDNVIKVDALEEFEEMKEMQVLETFEDEEHGVLARAQVGRVMVQQVQPQVATEFIYEPGDPEE